MKRQFFSFLILFLFVFSISAQTKEARLIDEFGFIQCGEFMARADSLLSELLQSQNSKIYIIYYEGMSHTVLKETANGRKEIAVFPKLGNALNRAKEITLYAEERRKDNPSIFTIKKEKIIFVDGGYRGDFTLEIWLVPDGAKAPMPTPTIDKKDIKFSKNKSAKTRNCARAYDYL